MGASQVPATTGSDNWVLISSVSPTASSASVTFSSIGSYKKLMLRMEAPAQTSNVAADTRLTFNADSGSNYTLMSGYAYNNGGTAAVGLIPKTGYMQLTNQSASAQAISVSAMLIINEVNTTGAKTVSGYTVANLTSSAIYSPNAIGTYFASAAITSLTLTLSTGTYSGTGTVALYGVAA
jgi:hypothetical protein